MFSYTMTIQLEYINHLLQFFRNIPYYAGIMLNAFIDLLYSELCWHNRLVPSNKIEWLCNAILCFPFMGAILASLWDRKL